MNDTNKLSSAELMELTAEIVAAYVSNNAVQPDALAGLIGSVDAALKGLASGAKPAAEPVELVPAVSVKKSITPDFIVCLEDGKKFKSLKRHLRTAYDMTPDDYRAKWGLPHDYPMVAPNYAAARSALAKASGLGQQRKAAVKKVAARGRKAKN